MLFGAGSLELRQNKWPERAPAPSGMAWIGPLRALNADIARGTRAHVQRVMRQSTEGQVGAGFRQMDLADEVRPEL